MDAKQKGLQLSRPSILCW